VRSFEAKAINIQTDRFSDCSVTLMFASWLMNYS